jgi:hypothetical protein
VAPGLTASVVTWPSFHEFLCVLSSSYKDTCHWIRSPPNYTPITYLQTKLHLDSGAQALNTFGETQLNLLYLGTHKIRKQANTFLNRVFSKILIDNYMFLWTWYGLLMSVYIVGLFHQA